MNRMSRMVAMATLLLAPAFADAAAQGNMAGNMAGGRKMDRQAMGRMERMMAGWPKASREAAMFMVNKYGAPMHMNEHMAMWGKTGPWKRTVVYNYEVNHQFPGPHTDVMQQWVDYRVPTAMYDELAMYDGSVVAERTNGELSARCDLEAANFLAINLAHEIATGKRTAEDARRMYAEQIMAMKAGRPAPYTERLMFTPTMGGTMDADRPAAMRD